MTSAKWLAANPGYMKPYSRNYNLKKKYGITTHEWDALFLAQGSRCAGCGTLDPGSAMGWHTDHRGKLPCKAVDIRGILCLSCNHAARRGTKKDVERLRSLADYLEQWL